MFNNLSEIYKYKSIDDFIQLIRDNFSDFIEVIKLQGILINKFGGKSTKQKLIDKITSFINENCSIKELSKWNELLYDASLINEMYYKFYKNPMNKIVDTDNSIEAFLIVTEKFLQYINNIINNQENENYRLKLSFSVNENKQENRKQFYMKIHDILTRQINLVLASLLFYEYPEHNINTDIEIEDIEIQASYNHFVNVQLNDIINYVVDVWRLGGRKIKKENNSIYFEIIGNLDESYFIINERKESASNKCYLEMNRVIRDVGERYPKGEKITEYLYLDEFLTCVFLMEHFSTDDLITMNYTVDEIECTDISIKELVRAYYSLIDMSKESIIIRKEKNNSIQNWSIIIDECELIEWLKSYSLSESHAKIIVKQLTYRKGVDIFDAPLIKKESKYLLLPNLLINIDVGKLVLSLISEINTRGLLFEERIKKVINSQNIKCEEVYINDNAEYQCDLAIAIADELYLCECKAWNDFNNINGYYNMLIKMNKAKVQLDRIVEGFNTKKDLVNKKLGYEQGHEFAHIHKLVITLNMQGLMRKINDTYFVDYSCLAKFFDREKPGIRIYGKDNLVSKFKGFKEYEGSISNYKFLTMIKNPSNIEITRKNKLIVTNELKLEDISIFIPMYVPKYDSTKIIREKNKI